MQKPFLKTGIGLRAQHYQQILDERPALPWLEVHSENYFGDGGLPLYYLESIRQHYPISLHGTSLSIGSTDPFNLKHLKKLKDLIDRIEPCMVSEHLCWNSIDGEYFNELLPLPFTEEALAHVVQRIEQVQDYLKRPILIENITHYIEYQHSTIAEWDFIANVAQLSGCNILLDVNNIYVNAKNFNFDPLQYLTAIPVEKVQEIHLAGFTTDHIEGQEVLIDTHDQPIADAVWDLYEVAVKCFPHKFTLIEWDNKVPDLKILLAEAAKADNIRQKQYG